MEKLTVKRRELLRKFGKVEFTLRTPEVKKIEEKKPYIPAINGFKMARIV